MAGNDRPSPERPRGGSPIGSGMTWIGLAAPIGVGDDGRSSGVKMRSKAHPWADREHREYYSFISLSKVVRVTGREKAMPLPSVARPESL